MAALLVVLSGCKKVQEQDIPVESVTVSPETLELEEEQTGKLTATVTPENATNAAVRWTSYDETVATVDGEGNVTAVGAGRAEIVASAGDKMASCTVKVSEKFRPVESVSLSADQAEIEAGTSVNILATVYPNNATNKKVTWSSSDESVVTVDSKGKITAIGAGTAIITATAGDKSATCTVTVTAIRVESITLGFTSHPIVVGAKYQFVATVMPEDATFKTVTWSSSNPSVASVTDEGLVEAKKTGTTFITAAADGKEAKCRVDVVEITANMVDLGLSVKWADRNLGAANMYDSGFYYAWGEVEPKEEYSWSTYKWGEKTSLTKYNSSDQYGTVDNKRTLEMEDDAAHVVLGGKWRMATEPEMKELAATKDNVIYYQWVWMDYFFAKGWLITYKGNGQSIFLPAVGHINGTAKISADCCEYWFSRSYNDCACTNMFTSTSVQTEWVGARCMGFTIRPVLGK